MKFRLTATEHFLNQAANLPIEVYKQLQKQLELLSNNPRHPSLQTHEIYNTRGDYGGKIFEAEKHSRFSLVETYINNKYRFTWEYSLEKREIILRNADNHNDCLSSP